MAALSEVLKNVQQHCQQQQAKISASSKQVKFAPKPIMISTVGSASISGGPPRVVDTKAIIHAMSTTPSNITPVTSLQSSGKNGPASVRGMIRVPDDTNPRKVKNVLVSMPDHTYAKLKGNKPSVVESSSSEESSSSSDSESMETVEIKVTPPATAKPKQSASTGKARGRPRKQDPVNATTAATTVMTPQPRSILKPAISEVKVTYERVRRRGRGCGSCPGCLRDDCGNCCYCLDKPKFGGPGKKKQRCALRVCAHFKSAPGVRNSVHSKVPTVAIAPSEAVKLLTEATIPLLKRVEHVSLKHSPTPHPPQTTTTSSPTPVAGTSPNQALSSSAATPTGRNKVAGMVSGSGDEMMKCVMCGRERKLGMARSSKFCGNKCLKDWEMQNPGKSPEMAEPSSNNISLPLLLQAALDKPAVPRALKNLQIDMALPGERRHDPICLPASGAPELLEIGPLISSISGSPSVPTSSTSATEPSGMKRPSQDGGTPNKKIKIVTSPVSSIPSPVTMVAPVLSGGIKTNKKPKLNPAEVSKWSISDVVRYFENTGECSHIAPVLQEQEVDGEALLLLSHDSLVKCLGMKLGPALKVMTHVDRLKSQASSSY